MRKVLVSFKIFVSQSKEKPLVIVNPLFVFSGEFDLSDDNSHSDLCKMEYRVECVCKGLKELGCQVAAIREEVSHLEL